MQEGWRQHVRCSFDIYHPTFQVTKKKTFSDILVQFTLRICLRKSRKVTLYLQGNTTQFSV
jgi:hypothetical protein